MQFIKQFLSNPSMIGAVAPSSERLSDVITNSSTLSGAKSVVELGPGNGVFTKRILRKIADNATFFAIESNRFFFNEVSKRFPHTTVYHDSAINIQQYLLQHNLPSCDCVISGLPWAGFPHKTQQSLLSSIHNALSPSGEFLTFAYLHSALLPSGRRFRRLLRRTFRDVRQTKTVWKNMPPAYVYHCKK